MPEAVADEPKLGFFPGSTIGNMVARSSLDLLRSMLRAGGWTVRHEWTDPDDWFALILAEAKPFQTAP